jgi:15-cis-phytoene synthase
MGARMSEAPWMPPDADLDPHAITKRSGSNFLAGFLCLPRARRHAMTVIYAFCRVVDDAVDDAPDVEVGRRQLAFWQQELSRCDGGEPQTPVGRALAEAVRDFGIPISALEDLIAGCAMDLDAEGIADQEQLELYCYRVASAVGLACLPALGATSRGAEKFAYELGQALQFTNVLRDLRSDAEVDRCYVPQTWLAEFGLGPEDLSGAAGAPGAVVTAGLVGLCGRLAEIARRRFAGARSALRGLPLAERRALVAPRIMGAIYGDLLRQLERRGGDISQPRARVPRGRKIRLALSVWAGVRA